MKIVLVTPSPGALLALARTTFTVDHARNGDELADLMAAFTYDAVVLEGAGRTEMRTRIADARAAQRRVPILMLGVDDAAARIVCLREGADDVVSRGVAPEEVLARVTALIRRSTGHDSTTLAVDNLTVDLAAQEASVDGIRLDLTGKEFKLLRFLTLRAGSVLDKQQVLNALYTSEDEPDDRIVGVYLCTLRRKLRDGRARVAISTLRGAGYMLRAAAEADAPVSAYRAVLPVASRGSAHGAMVHAMA